MLQPPQRARAPPPLETPGLEDEDVPAALPLPALPPAVVPAVVVEGGVGTRACCCCGCCGCCSLAAFLRAPVGCGVDVVWCVSGLVRMEE